MHPGPLSGGQHRDAILAEVGARLAHIPHDAAVVVACSGGPDSTAVAFLTEESRPDLALTLVHVAHGLRDDSAEAELVADHAAWLGADCVRRRIEVPLDRRGLEAAARDERYAALREVADELDAATIVVGHTAEDQAETVLLRMARGTGVDGLAAMASHTDSLTRPMLRLRREDVHGFVTAEGLPSACDPTNSDPRIRRVIVRDEVLPALQRVAPDPVGALGRLAELAHGESRVLDDVAAKALPSIRIADAVVLDRARLRALLEPVARRVVHQALREVVGESPSAATVQRVLDAEPIHRSTLPGVITLEATRRWLAMAPPAPIPDALRLPTTGTVVWKAARRRLHVLGPSTSTTPDAGAGSVAGDVCGPVASTAAEQTALPLAGAWAPPPFTAHPAALPPSGSPERMEVRLPDDIGELWVRSAQPGDRISERAGRRRVVEVFRDAALPVSIRRRWPVVVADDTIVWVPGYAVDADLAVRGRESPHVVLRLTSATQRPSSARGRRPPTARAGG